MIETLGTGGFYFLAWFFLLTYFRFYLSMIKVDSNTEIQVQTMEQSGSYI